MKHKDIVKSLKNELLSAEAEINTLKEELRKKDWLIEREREKSQARTNAYLDCLRALTETKKDMNICKKKVEVLKEGNDALKEMWNGLTREKNKLEDVVQQKDKLIQRVLKKKKDKSKAYFNCLHALTLKENELNICEAKCDALQAGHHLEMSYVKETCRKKLEVLHENNAALKKTVNRLTTVKAKSEDEVQQKDKPIQRVLKKKQDKSKAYIHCLRALTLKENELNICEAKCDALQAGHHLEMSYVKETCRKKLEALAQDTFLE